MISPSEVHFLEGKPVCYHGPNWGEEYRAVWLERQRIRIENPKGHKLEFDAPPALAATFISELQGSIYACPTE